MGAGLVPDALRDNAMAAEISLDESDQREI